MQRRCHIILNEVCKVGADYKQRHILGRSGWKTIASQVKSADSKDNSTVIVENNKGLKGVIDYTGKMILPYKYKDVVNSSPTILVVTNPDGKILF